MNLTQKKINLKTMVKTMAMDETTLQERKIQAALLEKEIEALCENLEDLKRQINDYILRRYE